MAASFTRIRDSDKITFNGQPTNHQSKKLHMTNLSVFAVPHPRPVTARWLLAPKIYG